jgi:polysaccharide biosynthesis protein PslJ
MGSGRETTVRAPVERSAGSLTIGRRAPHLPPGWPIYALFLGFPLWWVLGLSAFILPIMAVPMAAWLFRQRPVLAPRGFAIWLAFLLWMFGSVTQVGGSGKFIHYSYTATLYIAVTIVLLYVFNFSREALPTHRVITIMTIFWMFVVVWGVLGVMFPTVAFTSLVETLLPERFATNEFVHELVHPALSQVQDILGYEQPRPKAPFPYSTNWGAAFGILTPFVILAWKQARSRPWKLLIAATFVAGIVPVVSSLDRGLWLSLGVGLTYAAIRLAVAGKGRALRINLMLIFTVLAVVYLTPLKTLVSDRFANPHSNERRIGLYQESIDRVLDSPLFGLGAPQPSLVNPNAPPIGTQGQLWGVLVPYGFVGAIFFVWWFVYQFWRFRSASPEVVLWCHTIILIAFIQMPFYDSIGVPLAAIMIAIAVASRELPPRARSLAPSYGRGASVSPPIPRPY